MPRPKRKRQYWEIKTRTIYVLLHPETKEFYIGHTPTQNLRSTYKDHYIEIKYKTANMVHQLKKENKKPCCFVLDEINCTAVQAYRYVIVWTKIFMEQGFINLDTNSVIDYANDLLPENLPLYEERKTYKISKLLTCNKCLFPDYGRQMCPLKKEIVEKNER